MNAPFTIHQIHLLNFKSINKHPLVFYDWFCPFNLPLIFSIGSFSIRFIMHDVSARQKKKEDDGDLHLAQKITHNHRYSASNQADEEYDYDGSPRRKTRKKGGGSNRESAEISNSANRFLTQKERCQFCIENSTRPKHLIIAIANFTYLSLPHQQPVVPGHCCISTLQVSLLFVFFHSLFQLDD